MNKELYKFLLTFLEVKRMEYKIKTKYLIDGINLPKKNDNFEITIKGAIIKNINQILNNKPGVIGETIDAEKFTLLPGLIDAHIHIDFNPHMDAKSMVIGKWYEEKKELRMLKASENARKLVMSGVTTVRDCGAHEDVSFLLRDSINQKLIPGPRLFISGNPITITGGHACHMGLEADTIPELIKSIRLMNKRGADFIKFMSSGGRLTSCSNERGIQYNLDEIKAIVNEAHKRKMKVATHALGTEAIINSIKANVDTIEHCAWLAPEDGYEFQEDIISEMVEKGIYINPTLPAAAAYLYRTFSKEEAQFILNERVKLLQRMYQSGVKILAGTDAGVPQVDFNQFVQSLKMLVNKIGLTKYETIKAGTSEAAKALGIEDRIGSIQKGKLADIIIVDGDPLEDLDVLNKIVMVIKDGDIVYRNHNMI
jgi:imidazolonepropionase-like amidohydrolase